MDPTHDDLFHFVFQHPRHTGPWLRTVLSGKFAGEIDWSTLRAEPEKVHRRSLRQEIADVVHSARMHGVATRARFVSEHKSWDDDGAEAQLTSYAILLARRQLTEDETELPIVVPVLLCHGDGPARTAPDEASFAEVFRPRVHILVDDLSQQTEAQIRARQLTPLAAVTFLCLRYLRQLSDAEALAALARWGELLRAADGDSGPPSGEEAIGAIAGYCLRVRGIPPRELHRHFENILQRPEKTIMSTAEKLKREGRELGRIEGKEEGLVEGRVEGRVETLLRQLNKRFGVLPAELEQRVRGGSLVDLDRWTDRVLDAETLDGVFAD